jgi:4-hydroxy-3-polyprenylbenzoate decarboxylase
MGIDATRKWPSEGHTRELPDVVKMDRSTAARVDAMWSQLGLGDLIPIPSVDGHIVAPMP